jgi:hypothetical protein
MFKWDLRGRPAADAIHIQQRDKILRSQMWTLVVAKPLLWVVEQAIDIKVVGAFFGPMQRPHLFICLVMRLLKILPKPQLVMEMLRQDVHKYLRVLALVVIRLVGNKAMLDEARVIGEEDYRKVLLQRDIVATVGDSVEESAALKSVSAGRARRRVTLSHVDEIADELLCRCESPVTWLGLGLNPLLW